MVDLPCVNRPWVMLSRRKVLPHRRALSPANAFAGTVKYERTIATAPRPNQMKCSGFCKAWSTVDFLTIMASHDSYQPFATIGLMRDAEQTLDQYFLEMRWRCLSLAADLDRVERATGGPRLLDADPRLQKLRKAISMLLGANGNRAEQVQMIFSDMTPPPIK
jgi:hypothetical protein